MMSSNENPLMKEIQIAASRLGARLFRQNTGMGWIGKATRFACAKKITVGPGDVLIRAARPFHAGFEGLADLGGWVPVTITTEHVGQTVAVYLQAEVKDGAQPSPEQLKWIAAVNRAGGIAGIVRTDDDLRALLTAKSGSKE